MSRKEGIPLEAEITKAIMRRLRDAGIPYLFKSAGGPYQRAGLPDIIGIAPGGRFFGLEVKRPQVGRATAIQLATLRDIEAAGGIVAIVHSPEEAERVLFGEREEGGHADEQGLCRLAGKAAGAD